MSVPAFQTIIDLRPENQSEPLQTTVPVIHLSMDDIEEGRHHLSSANGPFLVICERGGHAGLAARYLRADGLQAEAWKGPLTNLWEALQEQA